MQKNLQTIQLLCNIPKQFFFYPSYSFSISFNLYHSLILSHSVTLSLSQSLILSLSYSLNLSLSHSLTISLSHPLTFSLSVTLFQSCLLAHLSFPLFFILQLSLSQLVKISHNYSSSLSFSFVQLVHTVMTKCDVFHFPPYRQHSLPNIPKRQRCS